MAEISPTVAPQEPWVDAPLTGIRQVIARRMEESWAIPHFYLKATIDAESILNRSGHGVAVDDIVVLACAKALREHPVVNSAFLEGAIRTYERVHVGLAVATDRGLVVPVVHDADALDQEQVAAERARLVQAVRGRSAVAGDLAGGTFTVTNVGRLGMDEGWPLILPPQVAILAIGRIALRPVVVDGAVSAGPTMALTLAADHRVVDGADGAAFLRTIADFLEA
jgi:pyruvate dehydrogenase E2 component (dihydrolipoamide acetyltransferase)